MIFWLDWGAIVKQFGRAAINIGFSVLLTFTIFISAFAADAPIVVGSNINEDGAGLFLSGKLPDRLTAKISGFECEVSYSPLIQAQSVVRTCFLIDVSTSMRQGSRKQIMDLLTGLIENKKDGEQYGIAVFGEDYRVLADFTDDRYDLAKAVNQIEWSDQASSIYQAVGFAAKEIREAKPDARTFTQLVVFSDGVEKSDDGIIKEELFFGLKESPFPVHTIGFKYENNADGLKELYAISRITGGFGYELDSKSEVLEAANKLDAYIGEAYYVQVKLPDQLKDGAVRPLELFDGSGKSVAQYNIHMPGAALLPAESEPQPVSEPEPEPQHEQKLEQEQVRESPNKMLAIVLLATGVVVIAVITFVIIKKKSRKKTEAPGPEESKGEVISSQTQFIGADDDGTMFLIADDYNINESGFLLILNDLTQPHKRFEIVVDGMVEIGRNPNQPGISIDYDKRISRRHFSVSRREGCLWIEDLGSVNKTLVNDETVKASRVLRDNDVISCGNTKFSVRIERR